MKVTQHPEAAFLATMTASATHEVRNVLAIIKESAGLVADMVQACQDRGGLDGEKVFRAVDRIDLQVKRGAELLTNLNRLSHTLDQDLASLSLPEEVEQMVFLGQRFARKKGQRLTVGERVEASLSANPLHLQMLLFAGLVRVLESSSEGSVVTVAVRPLGDSWAVEYRGGMELGGDPDRRAPGAEEDASLEKLATSLGAIVQEYDGGLGFRILFSHVTQG